MKKSLATIFVTLLCSVVFGQTNLIQNIPSRKTTSLDGDWHSLVDPYNHGGYSFPQDVKFDGTALSDYDFDTSPTLRVPGDWNTQRQELMLYEGRVWYRTKFDYSLAEGRRLFVHFGAANYIAQVWLNGKLLGKHEGGYTPFEYEITDKVKATGNSLVVCVDDTRLPTGIPTMNTDWYNYGGLTRSVCLVETAQSYVQDYEVQVVRGNLKLLQGYIQLNEPSADKEVSLQIPELKIKKTFRTDADGRASFSIKAAPQLWTPEQPKLYDVEIGYDGDVISDQIGFRTIETEGDKILLNGKVVFLCGVNMHDESLATDNQPSRRCTTSEDDSIRIMLAKDMGCNFVRLAHYPHNEAMLRMADKLGVMVWSEIPLYWGIDWKSKQTYALAEQQLHEMVARDHNRCSVIIWSIANETAVNADRTQFLTNLANEAHGLDHSRLISAALQNVNKRLAPTVYTVVDPLKDALDIFSYNEYIGWYDAPKEFCDSITWQLDTDKPVVISEFGGGGVSFKGRENMNEAMKAVEANPNAFFNEDNQVSLYKHQFTMLRKIKGLAGTIPWVLIDFRSPHRMLQGIQDGYNRKGLYTERGEKKPAWYVVKAWNDEHRTK